MKIIVGGVILKDNKILMVQEAKKVCYGQWNFPAGHLDDGETIFEGALREILEETGCIVELTHLLPIITCKGSTGEEIMRINFLTKMIKENINFDPNEILDAKWISIEDIKSMPKANLRGLDGILRTIQAVENNELYPLDIFNFY